AKHLFNVPEKRIKVLVHPEAIVHSMVEFIDGAILAQLAIPDMRLPIQYALNYPKRLNSNQYKTDFAELKSLSFHEPDFKKFPCLSLAYEASRVGGTMPAVLNASNEEAVRSYLDGTLNFTGIPRLVEKVLKGHKVINKPVLGDIMDADKWARIESGRIMRSI
ncbi:MAG: 1-deoxy-D-xylulose-5-phosphate reductoisomerase, partial [Candidatus Omnitrophica bacterium]|nr:1-deoxy-D-xylulose-5-phosphate reductoisomerase [Candidatus Omnitrophota bacterium]